MRTLVLHTYHKKLAIMSSDIASCRSIENFLQLILKAFARRAFLSVVLGSKERNRADLEFQWTALCKIM